MHNYGAPVQHRIVDVVFLLVLEAVIIKHNVVYWRFGELGI